MTKTTEKPKHLTLAAALVSAQASARPVEKDARNKFHSYNYVSAEAMIADSKEILAAHGLALAPSGFELGENPNIKITASSKNGPTEFSCAGILTSHWTVFHEAGETMQIHTQWPVVPESGRPLDKAVAAARTASLSYLLRDLLQLPRVEEGTGLDEDSRDRHRGEPVSHRARPNEQEEDPRETSRHQVPPAKNTTAPASEDKRSATEVLLEFKARVDKCKTVEQIEKGLGTFKALEQLPPNAAAMAKAYGRARIAELKGEQATPEDDRMATNLNELTKE